MKRKLLIKMKKYLSLIFWITIYLAVAFGVGQITQGEITNWYAELEKPSFNPPNYLFPIVWTILYIMIATAGWKIWQSNKGVRELKWIFIGYTILNWGWTPIFFGGHEILIALIWIAVLNLVTITFILKSWNKERFASLFMMPPLLWTSFAMVLNYSIYILNT